MWVNKQIRQIGCCYSSEQSIRGLDPIENLEKFVTADYIEEIKQHNSKPLSLLHLIGKDITQLLREPHIPQAQHASKFYLT